jgi:hypothetical protein
MSLILLAANAAEFTWLPGTALSAANQWDGCQGTIAEQPCRQQRQGSTNRSRTCCPTRARRATQQGRGSFAASRTVPLVTALQSSGRQPERDDTSTVRVRSGHAVKLECYEVEKLCSYAHSRAVQRALGSRVSVDVRDMEPEAAGVTAGTVTVTVT